VSWSRRFEEPIELPDGRKLKTLAEAINWLAKEIPKSEHKTEKVQNAAHLVTRAAEHGGPMIFAQMEMLQAIHRHHKRSSIPIAKTTIGENENSRGTNEPRRPTRDLRRAADRRAANHLAGVWGGLEITGQSTLNRIKIFWSWAFGACVLAYGQP
jgi:hypothetical protein